MWESILPLQKMPKLIVIVAFDRDENGKLQAVFGPDRAERGAGDPESEGAGANHAGVSAWSREANPALGERMWSIGLQEHLEWMSSVMADKLLSVRNSPKTKMRLEDSFRAIHSACLRPDENNAPSRRRIKQLGNMARRQKVGPGSASGKVRRRNQLV